MSDPRTGDVLNRLLQSAYDSAEGFRQGAALARNPKFKSFFSERANERDEIVRTIEAEVRSFGADPAAQGTVIGEAHRLFTYARDVLSRDSDKGLVEELVRRGRVIVQAFESVADDSQEPDDARRVATDVFQKLSRDQLQLEGLGRDFTDGPDQPAGPDTDAPTDWRPRMAAQFKLTDDDNGFLAIPPGASVLFAGSSGTQSWIERAEDSVVRLGIQAVGVATADGGSLGVNIDVDGQEAKGEDGPAPIEQHLSAGQSVQLLVKAGERVSFKAFPSGRNAHVLRTVVWASDLGAPAKPPAPNEAG